MGYDCQRDPGLFAGGENVLEWNGGDGCTMLWILKPNELYPWRWISDIGITYQLQKGKMKMQTPNGKTLKIHFV